MNNFEEGLELIELTLDNIGPWYFRPEDNSRDPHWTWNCIARDWLFLFGPLLKTYVKNTSVVIQAGGWQGLYPRLLSERFDLVYTFEPDPRNFHVLTKNCQRQNILKFQAGLSETNSPGTLQRTESSGQGKIRHVSTDVPITIIEEMATHLFTIDTLGVADCGLIMLDVENLELPVLKGAEATIKKYKPVIITEKGVDGHTNQDIVPYVESLGYRLHIDLHEDYLFLPK